MVVSWYMCRKMYMIPSSLRGIWFYLIMIYLKLCTVADIKETKHRMTKWLAAFSWNVRARARVCVCVCVFVRKRSWPNLTFYPKRHTGELRKPRRTSDRLVGWLIRDWTLRIRTSMVTTRSWSSILKVRCSGAVSFSLLFSRLCRLFHNSV
jgi:hypothetical protein